jgi:hypothetical protein
MAFLAQNNKLQDPNQAQGQDQASGQTVPLSGSSGGVITGATGGQAPSGAGGQGSWTNIQAYLNANKGDTGSANMLNKQSSDTIGKEKQNVDQQSSQAKQQAQGQADQVNYSQDKASQILQDASKNYNYDSTQPQNDAYNQDTSQLKNALSAKYQGPTNFAYGISSDAQNFGQNLNSNPGFNQIMGQLYNKAGGGKMTSGQLALQGQLDVNNQALNQARQNAIANYAGLGDYVNQNATDTNNAIQGAQNQFTQNQQNLLGYLNTTAGAQQSAEKQAEDQAKTNYLSEYNGGESGLASALLAPTLNGSPLNFDANWYTSMGMPVNSNMTWAQLQAEKDHESPLGLDKIIAQNPDIYGGVQSAFGNNASALNNFYNQEESKYANTGDEQKRDYNAIMDILGNSDRMNQGFDVGAPVQKPTFPGGIKVG